MIGSSGERSPDPFPRGAERRKDMPLSGACWDERPAEPTSARIGTTERQSRRLRSDDVRLSPQFEELQSSVGEHALGVRSTFADEERGRVGIVVTFQLGLYEDASLPLPGPL